MSQNSRNRAPAISQGRATQALELPARLRPPAAHSPRILGMMKFNFHSFQASRNWKDQLVIISRIWENWAFQFPVFPRSRSSNFKSPAIWYQYYGEFVKVQLQYCCFDWEPSLLSPLGRVIGRYVFRSFLFFPHGHRRGCTIHPPLGVCSSLPGPRWGCTIHPCRGVQFTPCIRRETKSRFSVEMRFGSWM